MTAPERHRDIVFSMTRLMHRVTSPSPTGVDRVVLAYALAMARHPSVRFAGINPLFGRYGRLSRRWVLRYLAEIDRRWTVGDRRPRYWRKIAAFWWMVGLFPLPVPARRGRGRVLLDPSHSLLDRPHVLERILAREGALFIPLVHDLIPIVFPEYARAEGAAEHEVRMATMAQHSHAVLANSHATADALRSLLADRENPPDIAVAPLGSDAFRDVVPDPDFVVPSEPYFLCLGTIEPRKNHLLLLHLWRQMAAEHASAPVPRLVLVGRRGWENENIVDMLERSPGIRAFVTEHGRLPDAALLSLLRGARALLLPSFAEGFGLPVAEALAAGVPVICSDLPVLREVGQSAPEFLDPLDGPAWLAAIRDYASAQSPRRRAQCERMATWKGFGWTAHLDIVMSVVQSVADGAAEKPDGLVRASKRDAE